MKSLFTGNVAKAYDHRTPNFLELDLDSYRIYQQITLPVCWWARSAGAVRIRLSACAEETPPNGLVATGSDLDR